MNTANNKRRKTSIKKIETTFLQLIKHKNIDEISVSAICQQCGLNRSTFYSNYLDIYDLAEKVKEKIIKDFSQFQLINNAKQNAEGFLMMFQYIKENKETLKLYFKLETISETLIQQYDLELAKKFYDNKHIDYHLEFFKAGLNAVIKKWLENDCKESPEEICEIIVSEYKNKS